ncbi:MAG: sirohydrochlorin chelatase [bacterium]
MSESVLFMGHGSRDSGAVNECMSMVQDVEQSLGQQFTPGFLELSKPLLFPEIVRQINDGVERFLCFPNMLLPGRHTMDHLPGVIGWAQRHFPNVEFYYGNFIGNHPYVYEILYNNYQKALDQFDVLTSSNRTAVVVVGRGSTSDRSNRTFEKMVWRFREKYEISNLTWCYISLAEPGSIPTLHRVAQTGTYRRIMLLPYFLFTGVLIKRIRHQMKHIAEQYPGIQFVLGDYFGKDERLHDILYDRIQTLSEHSVNYRPNDFREISQKAGHHLHHLDIYGDRTAAPYLKDIPGCPEHRHPSSQMNNYRHGHLGADHESKNSN